MGSTDFSDTRFLVPWLNNYEGWAIFMDCDMLCIEDIEELWNLRDDRYSVMVRKHVHKVDEGEKFLGEKQRPYEKKNWSSLMLFNCKKCKVLNPDYVDLMPLLGMHQFTWLGGEEEIGPLPRGWNHLVGVEENERPKLIHWTEGGPYFSAYQHAPFADLWGKYYREMLALP